jgi:murein tripeptide amidase MpaA
MLSLFQMLSKYNQDSSVRNMVDKMDWVIMPSLNPDGYEHTWTRGVSLGFNNVEKTTKRIVLRTLSEREKTGKHCFRNKIILV